MKTTRILMVTALAAAGLQSGGCAGLPPGFVTCGNPCDIPIDVPSQPGRPPGTGNPTVSVAEGAQVQFTTTAPVLVIFTKDTPFVDSAGDLLYWIRIDQPQKLRVRDDSSTACSKNDGGCKYMVVDAEDPKRPVLDPYIIIDR